MRVSSERFEELAAAALDRLPKQFQHLLENVAVVIEDGPAGRRPGRFLTLGRYHGVPRISRQGVDPLLPDRITLYREDLAALAETEDALIKEIERTIWHEIGHHVGFSDMELRKLERRSRTSP